MDVHVQVTATDPAQGFTLGELRAFLAHCQLVEVPDTAYVRATQVRAFNKHGGRLKQLTVDE